MTLSSTELFLQDLKVGIRLWRGMFELPLPVSVCMSQITEDCLLPGCQSPIFHLPQIHNNEEERKAI